MGLTGPSGDPGEAGLVGEEVRNTTKTNKLINEFWKRKTAMNWHLIILLVTFSLEKLASLGGAVMPEFNRNQQN